MKIALAQMAMAETPEQNFNTSMKYLEEAATHGGDLICFPELQFGKFFPQYNTYDTTPMEMAESHPFIKKIQEACRRHHIMAAPNIYLCEGGNKYDATLLINHDGRILGRQEMIHIAQAEQFYEQAYYAPGPAFRVFDTDFGKIAIVVCFDRHYPESIRTQALQGAELIIIPTANTQREPLEMFEWEIRVQAFQNSVHIVMCNRTGQEDGMDFAGESLIADARGSLVAKASKEQCILYGDLDLKQSSELKVTRPYTSLRRPELYR